jgi:hypothetical protein
MERLVRQLVAAGLLILAVGSWPSVAKADDPPPPAVGATILEDSLSGPTVIPRSRCRVPVDGREFVGEGLRFKLTGRCQEAHTVTALGTRVQGLTVADGEVRLELKAVSGIDRAMFQIAVRDRPSTNTFTDSYYVLFQPGTGRAGLGKTNVPQAAAVRDDLGGTFAADDWNTLALRVQGPNIWFLLNDQPTLYFSDPSLERGEVIVNMIRRSTSGHIVFDDDPNDTTEVAVVIRNLRVSALADGDPARLPTYQHP